jgi:hypothetical protein
MDTADTFRRSLVWPPTAFVEITSVHLTHMPSREHPQGRKASIPLEPQPQEALPLLPMNHFMARLIFCFSATVDRMRIRDSSNTHEVIEELFRAMNTQLAERGAAKIKPWASVFPYVNGGLFGRRSRERRRPRRHGE